MDDFERELKQALERRPAPPSLKRKIMQRRRQQSEARRHGYWLVWQRAAAGLLVAAMLGGAMEWRIHKAEERRKGEEARRQVMIALRITGRALNEMNARLARSHSADE